jgi:hypothetical protein
MWPKNRPVGNTGSDIFVCFSFGVFIPYIKEHFDAGSGEVSTIYSIQVGVTFGAGKSLPRERNLGF